MASAWPGSQCSTTVFVDHWTAAVASAAAKRGEFQGFCASDKELAILVGASDTETAQAQQQAATPHPICITSKFNIPQPSVLQLLRVAYYGATREAHKSSATTEAEGAVAPSLPTSEASIADGGSSVEGREAKRLKAVVGSDSGAVSRRGAAALQRLCTALGVLTQQQHLPAHNLSYAVASSRGWRMAMEDTYAAEVPLHGTYGEAMFGLYDGHGGAEVARFSALHMGGAIRKSPYASAFKPANEPSADPVTSIAGTHCNASGRAPAGACSGSPSRRHAALREAFLSLDRQLADETHCRELMALANPGTMAVSQDAYGRRYPGGPYVGPAAGSTASVALVGRRAVTVAAVGDSRCILGSRSSGLRVVSQDHKGSDEVERQRVLAAGCWVSPSGRVCGELDMSRALGDADMKQTAGLAPHLQAVTAEPTVMTVRLEPHGCAVHCDPQNEISLQMHGNSRAAVASKTTTLNDGNDAAESGIESGQGLPGKLEAHDPWVAAILGGEDWEGGDEGGGIAETGKGGAGGGMVGSALQRSAISAPSIGNDGSKSEGGNGEAREQAGDSIGNGDGVSGPMESTGTTGACVGGGGSDGCYLLLASDGLWNVLTSEVVHEFVLERLEAGVTAESICAQLCVEACVSERTAYDNVTVMLIQMYGVEPVGEVHVAVAADAAAEVLESTSGDAEAEMTVEVEIGGGQADDAVGEEMEQCRVTTRAESRRNVVEEGKQEVERAKEGLTLAGPLWSEVAAPSGKPASSQLQASPCSIKLAENFKSQAPLSVDEQDVAGASSAAAAARCELDWQERVQALDEESTYAEPLEHAICHIWRPKVADGVVESCRRVGFMASVSDGPSECNLGIVSSSHEGLDGIVLESSPMQEDASVLL